MYRLTWTEAAAARSNLGSLGSEGGFRAEGRSPEAAPSPARPARLLAPPLLLLLALDLSGPNRDAEVRTHS